jgi:hypothetical protein
VTLQFPYSLAKSLRAFGVALALVGSLGVAQAQQPVEMNVVPPELVGGSWLNTPQNRSIKIASRKGKVTVIEFWTFG